MRARPHMRASTRLWPAHTPGCLDLRAGHPRPAALRRRVAARLPHPPRRHVRHAGRGAIDGASAHREPCPLASRVGAGRARQGRRDLDGLQSRRHADGALGQHGEWRGLRGQAHPRRPRRRRVRAPPLIWRNRPP
eukprot:5220171-Prymnesium_polylepis.1